MTVLELQELPVEADGTDVAFGGESTLSLILCAD